MQDSSTNPADVLAALRRQLDCYLRLSKLAKVQHDHVQNSRTEELLELLAQRQVILDEMAKLEQIVGPAKRNWQQYAGALSPADRNEAEDLIAQTRRLLEEIAAADRDDTLVLQQRKLTLGRGISQATAARKFNHAYASAAYGAKGNKGFDARS